MNYFEAKQKLIEHNNSREYNTHPLSIECYAWQNDFELRVIDDKQHNATITTSRQTGRTTCALALAIHKATEEQRKIIFLVDRPVVINQLKHDIETICEDALKNIKFEAYESNIQLQGCKYECTICDLMQDGVNCAREFYELVTDENFIFQEFSPRVRAW